MDVHSPKSNSPIPNQERQNYEEAISKLVVANSLQKFLLGVIIILAVMANVLLFMNAQSARSEAARASVRQEEILKRIDTQTKSNVDQTQRILNYLNCIGTIPVENRTQQLVENCFKSATPPGLDQQKQSNQSSSSGVADPLPSLSFVSPSQPTGRGGSISVGSVQPASGGTASPTPGSNPSPSPSPTPTPTPTPTPNPTPSNPQPQPPTILEVLTGTVNGVTCNKTLMVLCSQR